MGRVHPFIVWGFFVLLFYIGIIIWSSHSLQNFERSTGYRASSVFLWFLYHLFTWMHIRPGSIITFNLNGNIPNLGSFRLLLLGSTRHLFESICNTLFPIVHFHSSHLINRLLEVLCILGRVFSNRYVVVLVFFTVCVGEFLNDFERIGLHGVASPTLLSI